MMNAIDDMWTFFRGHLPNNYQLNAIRALGISGRAIATAGGLAWEKGLIAHDGRFEPGGHVDHIIVPVYEGVRLVDLVVFDPKRPHRCGQMLKRAHILGDAWLDSYWDAAEPCPVYRTPCNWLRAECEGVVVLDWTAGREYLRGRHALIGEDKTHALELHDLMRPEPWRGEVMYRPKAA